MSTDSSDTYQSKTIDRYAIQYADGTLEMQGSEPWWSNSKNNANNRIFDSRAALKAARIPEDLWPHVVTIKTTTTWHTIQEVGSTE